MKLNFLIGIFICVYPLQYIYIIFSGYQLFNQLYPRIVYIYSSCKGNIMYIKPFIRSAENVQPLNDANKIRLLKF